MKTAFFLIVASIGVLWFANDSIQDVGLMVRNGDKWSGTAFTGWNMFRGAWVVLIAAVASAALLFAGLVAWLQFDFDSREKELNAKLAEDKQKTIAELEKSQASQIENLFFQQTNNSKHLENAYADVEKYKRRVENLEDDNALLAQKMKGKDAVIMRLDRKIKRLTSSF